MNKKWTVYYHKFPDGQIYVGITSQPNPKDRWGYKGHGYKGQKVYDLIEQYDWDTEVQHVILATDLTEQEASEMEIDLIASIRNEFPDRIKYNIADGGFEAGKPPVVVHQYDLDGNFIQSFPSMTEAARATCGYSNIGLISSCCHGHKFSCYNFQWSFEKHDNIGPYKDKIPIHGKPIDQFDVDGNYIKTYPNCIYAKEALNLSEAMITHISECCTGKRRLAGGYQWRYHSDNPVCPPLSRKKSARIIDQYDLQNNYLTTWIGLDDLKEYFSLKNKPTHILDVCNGKRKTAYGFIWKFNPQDTKIKNDYTIPCTILQYDLDDNLVGTYPSIAEANKYNPITTKNHILLCCEGKEKTHQSFKWKYQDKLHS